MRRSIGAALILTGVVVPAHADPLDSVLQRIQPTRAVFLLRQAGDPPAGALTISGRFTIEKRITCREIANTVLMELRMTAGAQSESMHGEYQDAETRNGRTLRLSNRVVMGDREMIREAVEVTLESREGPGGARISGAKIEALKLEAGTVLPGTHFLSTLAAALEGTRYFEQRVFIGTSEARTVSKRVTILARGRAATAAGLGEFADKPGWSIRTERVWPSGAMSGQAQSDDVFLTEDGVTTYFTLRFMAFELIGTPISIEKLPKTDCLG